MRSFDDIEFGDDVQVKAGELELAEKLIEQLSAERFEPEKYEDEYRQAVLEAVDRKVAGEEVVAAPKPESREQIIDLVAALKKSLAGERKPAKKKTASGTKRARKTVKARGRSTGSKKSGSA